MTDDAAQPNRDDQVTSIRPEVSPAEAATKIGEETIPLREVAKSLPLMAAEMARSNALAVQTIRLQQQQIVLLTECVRAIQQGQAAGVDLQKAQLEAFSGLFGPLSGLINAEANRRPSTLPPPVEIPPTEKTGPGTVVAADAPEGV